MKKKSPSTANTRGISLAAQRTRLLEALKRPNYITTFYARHKLSIKAPAAIVFELRHVFGWNIQTLWCYENDPEGRPHRVAEYVLFYGKHKGRNHV